MIFSIDQNCHSLWDVIPKLQALLAKSRRVTHFVEDVDVAFTALGAPIGSEQMRLARERFYRSGGADWGAAVFYSEFLGRLPTEIRQWEPYTGMKTKALAKELGRSVDDLYEEFSPGDNWQLIGCSYVADRGRHRLIGDLTVSETRPFLREIMAKAKADTFRAFPERDSQQRLAEWFAREEQLLQRLLSDRSEGRLVDLYRGWLREYLGDRVRVDLTSQLFACSADPARVAILEPFLRDYPRAAELYNEAIEETGAQLRPLRTADGELPFFAVYQHQGRWVRSVAFLDGGEIRIADRAFPLGPDPRLPIERLRDAGISALVGKAILMAIQVRLGDRGAPLAVPYRGSAYLPAAHRLARKLAAECLLAGRLQPLLRVRFGLLDRMKGLDTTVRLPGHLAACFGREEIPARMLGENHAALAEQASQRLEAFKDPAARRKWQQETMPKRFEEISLLDQRRREIAQRDPKAPEIRAVWKRIKTTRAEILARTLRQIAADWHVRDLDYWDSRGALLPWCIALGGETFYNKVVQEAEIYEETAL